MPFVDLKGTQQGQCIAGRRQKEADKVSMGQPVREGSDIYVNDNTFYPKAKKEGFAAEEQLSGICISKKSFQRQVLV